MSKKVCTFAPEFANRKKRKNEFRNASDASVRDNSDRPWWWNGRHGRLKICCSQGREGSSPSRGTKETTNLVVSIFFGRDLEVGAILVERVFSGGLSA